MDIKEILEFIRDNQALMIAAISALGAVVAAVVGAVVGVIRAVQNARARDDLIRAIDQKSASDVASVVKALDNPVIDQAVRKLGANVLKRLAEKGKQPPAPGS